MLAEGPGNAWSAGEPTDNVRTVSRSAADIPTAITRRFWDAHSKGWDEIRAQPAGQVYIAASIDKLVVVLPPRASVIDLGCGPGHHSAAIAGRGLRVTGVDYSSRMLERARAKHPGVIYSQADLNYPDTLPSGPFDGALCVSVLQFIADPAALLRRVHDILVPGGHFLIEVSSRPCVLSDDRYLGLRDRAINQFKRKLAQLPGIVRPYDAASLAGLIRAAGFTLVGSPSDYATIVVLASRS